jgi:glucose/arabinose dehydrogenase
MNKMIWNYLLPATSLFYISCNNNSAEKENNQPAVAATAKDSVINTPAPIVAPDTSHIPFNISAGGFSLSPHHISLRKGVELDVQIPQGYNISIAFEDLRRLRFLTKSPDGRLFATDMHDRSDNKKGSVYIFDGWNDSLHAFTKKHIYLDGLHNPNQVAFYKNGDKEFIYVAETGKLSYYEYHAGDTIATGAPVVIATFPDYGLSYKYGGWHLTRSLAFHNNKLYVSVGSSCNACIEKEWERATVIEMNPDGSDKKAFATGLRNSVGIKWIDDQLWATSMGRDLIGPDKPEELFLRVERGFTYHWPYYYQYQNKVYPDEQMQDSAKRNNVLIPAPPPVAYAGFKAHSAPLGFDYFKGFNDSRLNNAVLVALHGSTSVWRERGNSIVKVNGGNNYEEVVTGFLTGKTEADRKGRPCDVLMNDDHSFFFTDDHNGVLYYVWKEGVK